MLLKKKRRRRKREEKGKSGKKTVRAAGEMGSDWLAVRMELRVSDSIVFKLHIHRPLAQPPLHALHSLLRSFSTPERSPILHLFPLPSSRCDNFLRYTPPATCQPASIPPPSICLFFSPSVPTPCALSTSPITLYEYLFSVPCRFFELPILPDDRSCPGPLHPPRWIMQTCGLVEQSRTSLFCIP